MTKYFQKPFFRKLFLSYTAILLACSLVFSSILFQQILQRERSVQEQQCRSDAQLLMQVVDDKFTEIENIGTQLASAQWFQKVRSQSEILNSSITVLERRDICQELQTYYSILQVADSIALLLPEKEQAVDRVSFWEEERYFSSIGLEKDLIDEETEKALVESYKSMLLVPGENGSFYVFKQLNYGTEPDSVLFCLINASWFQQFLSQRFADSLGSLEIISDGEVVFSMTQEGESPDQWQRFELDSNLYQWTYSIAIQPPQTAFAGQGLMLGSLLLLVLLVGGALALFLARASYAPLFQLMQRLNLIETQENEQEFQALEHVFQDLGKQNRDLEQISTQYYNTMRTNLISSLLAGAFSEERLPSSCRCSAWISRRRWNIWWGFWSMWTLPAPSRKRWTTCSLTPSARSGRLPPSGWSPWISSWWAFSPLPRAAEACLRAPTWCGITVPHILARMWGSPAGCPRRA